MRHRATVFPQEQGPRAGSRWAARGFVVLALLLAQCPAALAQHQDISIYSTQDGGGELVAAPTPNFENPVFESLCIASFCLYSSTDPGLITPSQGGSGLFPLKSGTPVSLELVAADASVSIKIGSVVLSSAGASVPLGTAPSLHVHPTYQVQRPVGPGQFGGFPLSFRFKATGYIDSPIYQMTLSNAGSAFTPTPSPTPSPSPTRTPASPQTPTPVMPTPGPTAAPPSPTPGATLAPTPRPTLPSASATPAPLLSATPSPVSTALPSPTGSPAPPTSTPRATAPPTPSSIPTPTAPLTQPSPSPSGSAGQFGSRDRLRVTQHGARGDQVVFFYDARDGFQSFLSVANEGDEDLLVELLLYGSAMETAHALRFDLSPGATRTVDIEAERERGLAAAPGVAFATAVRDDGQPVVSRALSGSLSVANLATNSSWGAPGAARLAFHVNDDWARLPALGRSIDGTRVRLQRLAPEVLHLPVYYESGVPGERELAFVSFRDIPGPLFVAAAEESVWLVRASHKSGVPIPPRSHATRGVDVADLASVLGTEVAGAAGRAELRAGSPMAQNRLVYFIQALGPFAMGYALPAVDGRLGLELR